MSDLQASFASHINKCINAYQTQIVEQGYDYLIIPSGNLKYTFQDDRSYPFAVNPHFKAFVPIIDNPNCVVVVPASGKPQLLYNQPIDFWHKVAGAPEGFWVEHFDITPIANKDELVGNLPDLRNAALLGEYEGSMAELKFKAVNPDTLIQALNWLRGKKTTYEQHCMMEANRIAVAGHLAARDAFLRGESELDIHLAYQKATRQGDEELPYTGIVGLNQNAAILHYTARETTPPAQMRSFLIDAGANYNGYAADITRTYTFEQCEFTEIIERMDKLALNVIDQIKPGLPYPELHRSAHLQVAEILRDHQLVNMAAEDMVAARITSAFYPHGLGHFIGLLVHDAGGHQADPSGTLNPPPAEHPFLRLTRNIEVDQVFTIEPGLYFIDSLLAQHRDGQHKAAFNWEKIEAMKPYGGVRVEDDVIVRENGVTNMTREAFAEASA